MGVCCSVNNYKPYFYHKGSIIMAKRRKKITEIDVYKSDRQLVYQRAAYRHVIFYKTIHIVIVVQFVNAWQFIIQQTAKATKCAVTGR